jgi:hypothetical protein
VGRFSGYVNVMRPAGGQGDIPGERVVVRCDAVICDREGGQSESVPGRLGGASAGVLVGVARGVELGVGEGSSPPVTGTRGVEVVGRRRDPSARQGGAAAPALQTSSGSSRPRVSRVEACGKPAFLRIGIMPLA